jgi:hypothetical protein
MLEKLKGIREKNSSEYDDVRMQVFCFPEIEYLHFNNQKALK